VYNERVISTFCGFRDLPRHKGHRILSMVWETINGSQANELSVHKTNRNTTIQYAYWLQSWKKQKEEICCRYKMCCDLTPYLRRCLLLHKWSICQFSHRHLHTLQGAIYLYTVGQWIYMHEGKRSHQRNLWKKNQNDNMKHTSQHLPTLTLNSELSIIFLIARTWKKKHRMCQ
jgi:hypothetical protein